MRYIMIKLTGRSDGFTPSVSGIPINFRVTRDTQTLSPRQGMQRTTRRFTHILAAIQCSVIHHIYNALRIFFCPGWRAHPEAW